MDTTRKTQILTLYAAGFRPDVIAEKTGSNDYNIVSFLRKEGVIKPQPVFVGGPNDKPAVKPETKTRGHALLKHTVKMNDVFGKWTVVGPTVRDGKRRTRKALVACSCGRTRARRSVCSLVLKQSTQCMLCAADGRRSSLSAKNLSKPVQTGLTGSTGLTGNTREEPAGIRFSDDAPATPPPFNKKGAMDILGAEFGLWTVIAEAPKDPAGNRQVVAQCGGCPERVVATILLYKLVRKHTIACGACTSELQKPTDVPPATIRQISSLPLGLNERTA